MGLDKLLEMGEKSDIASKLGDIGDNTAAMAEQEADLNQKTRQLLNATRKRDIFEIRQTRGLIREFENLRSAVREGTGRTTDAVKKIDIPSPGGRGSDVRSRMP